MQAVCRARRLSLVLLALGVWLTTAAFVPAELCAQQPAASRAEKKRSAKAAQRPARRATKAQAARRKPAAATTAQTERTPSPSRSRPATTKSTPPAAPAADGTAIRTEGDTQVKVMEFRGLDIEGQLRTPQMLYFLNRMRAEFGRPRLPHRSFMPELSRSAKERVF